MNVLLAGFLTGLSLIVAIGAQNAYVLRMGLSKQHVAVIVTICIASDITLIGLGVGGVGAIVSSAPIVLQVLRWVGVAYLLYVAYRAFEKLVRSESLSPAQSASPSKRVAITTILALTFLNPHVYIDTVFLLGSIGNQYAGGRWLFALGAATSSILWFSLLGFGAGLASPLMARAMTWRVLDGGIGVVMLLVAAKLVCSPVA